MTGKQVREFRLRLKLSQREFGKRLGYKHPQVAVSRIENTTHPISGQIEIALRLWEQNERLEKRERGRA